MTTVGSSLSKPDDGTTLVQRQSLQQLAGVRKQLTRSEFDAAIAAERTRITQNSVGIYLGGEEFAILGEVGYRTWLLATGGSDAVNAAASHARTVNLGGGVSTVVAADSNVAVSGQPTTGLGSANGDVGVVWGVGLFVRTGGQWPATPAVSLAASGGGSLTTTAYAAAIPLDLTGGRDMGAKYLNSLAAAQVLSVATSPAAVPNASCNLTLVADGDGTHGVTLAQGAFANAADFSYVNTAGQVHEISFVQRSLGAYVYVTLGGIAPNVGPPVPAPSFTAQAAPGGTVGTAYSYQFAASNTASYAVTSGSLPAGLSLSSAGLLAGTPTAAATSTFVVTATGTAGATTASSSQSVVIAAPSPAPTLSTLFEDGFTAQNSTHTDGAGANSVDLHQPDISNAEGNRWAGFRYDYMTGGGARVTQGGGSRFCYPVASAKPGRISASFALDTGDNILAANLHFRDDGNLDTGNYYYFYVDNSHVELLKVLNNNTSSVASFATAAWANGVVNTLVAAIDNTANTIAVSVGGTQVFTASLDSFAAAKGVAIGCNAYAYSSNNRAAYFSNVKVSAAAGVTSNAVGVDGQSMGLDGSDIGLVV